MKEIKFRLRSPIDKIVGYEKWYSGCLDSKNFWVAKPCWLYSEDGNYWNPKLIEHRNKDSFTGLKDKNRKEMWESDLIIVPEMVDDDDKPIKEWIGEVVFTCGSFMIKHLTINQWEDIDIGNLEIIGNKYENPELLKEVV